MADDLNFGEHNKGTIESTDMVGWNDRLGRIRNGNTKSRDAIAIKATLLPSEDNVWLKYYRQI